MAVRVVEAREAGELPQAEAGQDDGADVLPVA
jgi:hypothetical protein